MELETRVKSLDELGYYFDDGEISVLRSKENKEKFKGKIETPLSKSTREASLQGQGLDNVIQSSFKILPKQALIEYVYEFLETRLQLEKIIIPVDAGPKDPKGFFFMTKNALECDKLMILIQGCGEVRAGLWSRRLALRKSFESGTVVPYIEQAKKEGFGVIITNGNHNEDSGRSIKDSKNPKVHFVYVWNNFIKNAKAEHILVVAHSYGGKVVLHGLGDIEEAKTRIKAIAFTQSIHSTKQESMGIKSLLKEKARNWVTSQKPLDAPVKIDCEDDCDQVSAGTESHYETSHSAKESVFCFLKEKLKEEESKLDESDGHEDHWSLQNRKPVDERASDVKLYQVDAAFKEIVACHGGQDLHTISATAAADAVATYLNLDKLSMADPPADVTQKCRAFCCFLRKNGRRDIIKELRNKIPSGMTGPLLEDDMSYMKMDFVARRDLTRALCGNDLWKRLASELQIPGDHIGYYERKDNPAEAVLEDSYRHNRLTVGDLYDVIVRCHASALADTYM